MMMWVPMKKGDGFWLLNYIRTVLSHFIPHLARHPISPVDKISECLRNELLDSFWLHVYIHTYIILYVYIHTYIISHTYFTHLCMYSVWHLYISCTYTNKCAYIYTLIHECTHTQLYLSICLSICLPTYIYLDALKHSTWNIFRPMNSGKCKASIWQSLKLYKTLIGMST